MVHRQCLEYFGALLEAQTKRPPAHWRCVLESDRGLDDLDAASSSDHGRLATVGFVSVDCFWTQRRGGHGW